MAGSGASTWACHRQRLRPLRLRSPQPLQRQLQSRPRQRWRAPRSRPAAAAPSATAPPPAAYAGTPANSNTQGFVQGKLDDPALGASNKYQGGRYLTAHPGDVQGLVQQPGFEGWTVVGPDKVKGPGGSVYDVRNANGAVQ